MIVRTTTLALMLLAQTLMAQTRPEPAPLPPVLPWSGASERLIVPDRHPWATPAERARFETTPDYAETRAWLEKLAAASPLLSIERFGTSAEGRELYAVRVEGWRDEAGGAGAGGHPCRGD
jgi:hypothetical protein